MRRAAHQCCGRRRGGGVARQAPGAEQRCGRRAEPWRLGGRLGRHARGAVHRHARRARHGVLGGAQRRVGGCAGAWRGVSGVPEAGPAAATLRACVRAARRTADARLRLRHAAGGGGRACGVELAHALAQLARIARRQRGGGRRVGAVGGAGARRRRRAARAGPVLRAPTRRRSAQRRGGASQRRGGAVTAAEALRHAAPLQPRTFLAERPRAARGLTSPRSGAAVGSMAPGARARGAHRAARAPPRTLLQRLLPPDRCGCALRGAQPRLAHAR